MASLPVRGAWVEMILQVSCRFFPVRRSPCGERGLKFAFAVELRHAQRRSPCGERGLKYRQGVGGSRAVSCRSPCGERGLKSSRPYKAKFEGMSLPVRGAWVEIARALRINKVYYSRSPCGERGLKSSLLFCHRRDVRVAPRAGSVG